MLLYCRRIAGDRTLAFGLPPTRIVLTVTAVMTLLIPVAHGVVLRLPAADNGIPENWFPAATLFALGLFLMAAGGSATGAVALALSACFGAGLYGYVGLSDARLAVTMLGTVIAGVMAAALHQRAARRSPRSAQHSVQ